MNFKEILELIDKVAESGIGSVEVEQAGTKVRIEGKSTAPAHAYVEAPAPSSIPMTIAAAPSAGTDTSKAARPVEEDTTGLHIITSPIVGTFYRSPNPESQPFVNVGDRITKGKVLCIIEAMKLMNEIESDVDGVITAIYPQNGQPIEYGEKLFAVKV
ncbi:MAG TPA: acetyl-CoA carboxylase biotin carboxyl carrier protein [Thermoanaerobaculia bacterium]|nr:acetyl-CoA carboxylase biotin carboxyl carrier protein [Thermoanaerobaculia bacterium]